MSFTGFALDSQAEHTRWQSALEALKETHGLSFEEFDAIESGANGEAISSLEEGYVFGLAVGRQLRAEDLPRGAEDDELAALRAVTGDTVNEPPTPEPDEPRGERTAPPAAG